MTTANKLKEMFKADRDSENYFQQFPAYEFVHAEIGAKPWHPPAEQVWQRQGKPTSWDDVTHTEECWSILCDLYGDYLAAQ